MRYGVGHTAAFVGVAPASTWTVTNFVGLRRRAHRLREGGARLRRRRPELEEIARVRPLRPGRSPARISESLVEYRRPP